MSEWKKCKIGEMVTLRQGFAINAKSKHFISKEPTSLALLRIADMKSGSREIYIKEDIPQSFIANPCDIIYTRTGNVGLVFRNNFGVVHNNCFTVTPNDENVLSRDFLFYLLQSQYFFEKANSLARGAAQPDLPHSLFNSIEVAYPSLNDQIRIATILSRYDILIENYQKQIKLLEEAAQRLYKEWFVELRFPGHENTKMVDGLPEGWERKKLGEILEYYDKQRKPLSSMQRMDMEKVYPYYGAATLMDYVDNYIFDGVYLLLGEDGTVITSDNYPVLQYVWGKFWVNNHAHVLRGKNGISTEYLYSMFKEMPIADVVTGAAQPKISQGRLSEKKIVVPPTNLITKWSETTKVYFDSLRNFTEEIRLLTEARDRLLPRLMGGEMEVDAPKGQRAINPAHRSGYNPQTNHAPKGQKN